MSPLREEDKGGNTENESIRQLHALMISAIPGNCRAGQSETDPILTLEICLF